jgi:membrane-bound lytic murein transglycosylase D
MMKKQTIPALTLILALILSLPPAAAQRRNRPIFHNEQGQEVVVAPARDATTTTDAAAAPWAPAPEQLDSLLVAVHGDGSVAAFERFFDDFIRLDTTIVLTSDTPDSVYQRRLRSILSPIGLPWNDIVKQYIVMYTTARRTTLGNILGRSQYYFPLIEAELSQAGLPLELRMLAAIESALVPSARSRAGAVGLWQFMYPTARQYGLEITTFVDQRNDPVASTRAACRYLAFLYRTYGDWTLALAAYNCGPGNLNRALKRAGGNASNFWDVYNYLPAETRGYVPSFIAITYAYTYHKQHGIEITDAVLPLVVDTVSVGRLVHLEQVATTLDIPIETLRALNPQYLKDVVPALDKTYPLVMPLQQTTNYVGRAEEIHSKDSIYLAQYLNPANIDSTRAVLTAAAANTVHRVRNGETLGHIAIKYGVSVSQIMRWNNLKNSNRLSIGQRLVIQK